MTSLFVKCAVPRKIHTHPIKGQWKFLGGGGCKTKSLPWGEYGYFLELHNNDLLFIQMAYFIPANIVLSASHFSFYH